MCCGEGLENVTYWHFSIDMASMPERIKEQVPDGDRRFLCRRGAERFDRAGVA